MITAAFSEIVGLLCHYRQEKGDREALDHQKFMEWLPTPFIRGARRGR